MARIATPRATAVFHASLVVTLLGVIGLTGPLVVWARSDGRWNVNKSASQPIPFLLSGLILAALALGIEARAKRSCPGMLPSW